MSNRPLHDFEQLEVLRRYLSILTKKHVISLKYYFDSSFAGFHHKHEKDKRKMSKSSTATCVVSLIRARKWQDGPWKDTSSKTVTTLLTEKWQSAGLDEDNPFTVAFILEAVSALNLDIGRLPKGTKLVGRRTRAINILTKSVSEGAVNLGTYPDSAYLTQLSARVLEQYGKLKKETKIKITEWAWREIDRQLALLLANSQRADVYQLIYSVILAAEWGDPGEATPDQSLILRVALDQFFARQLEDGTWPRSLSLFHYPGVGSAYCYEYEMLAQLLECHTLRDPLLRYLEPLKKAAIALENTSFRAPLIIQFCRSTAVINQWLRSRKNLKMTIVRGAL